MPIFEIETDQGVFEIDADREPTQAEALQAISGQVQAPTQLKPSTQQTLSEDAALRQQIISQAQRTPLQKSLALGQGVAEAVASPFVSGFKALPGLLELAAEPTRILPTTAEALRRVLLDVVGTAKTAAPAIAETALQSLVKNPFSGLSPLNLALQAAQGLRSRTPTEEEIQRTIEGIPSQQAFKEIREKVPEKLPFGGESLFRGAQPEVAEATAEIAPLFVGVGEARKALQIATKGVDALSQAPRLIRSAIKPTKAQMGARIEKAAEEEIEDIFNASPNADKLGSTPIEGFASEVKNIFTNVGNRLSELRKLSGSTLNAGDEVADKILEKAVSLESAGQPRAIIEELTNRAQDIRGKLTDLNSLQDAVTIANRKPNILKPKTTAEGFVDEIIAKEGGSLINKELGSLRGTEGLTIRKKWSNLKTLSDNLEERVNKLINNAPAEAQPALLQALASPEGVASVFALFHGWTLPGAITLASKVGQNWLRSEAKNLKDSNVIIERMYENLRKNVPSRTANPPPVIPPPVIPATPQTLNQALAQQVSP